MATKTRIDRDKEICVIIHGVFQPLETRESPNK
jgi:hypothetical protein